jgi:hypothetical protein
LNRRRFLKYAGATAAVAGVSALGLGFNPTKPTPSEIVGVASSESSTGRTSLSSSMQTTISRSSSYKYRFPFQGGILLDGASGHMYDSAAAKEVTDHLIGLPMNWIMLRIRLNQPSPTSSSVGYLYDRTPAITLTKTLRAQGINVAWTPAPQLPDSYLGTPDKWIGNIHPADLNAWFLSYGTILKQLATDAEKTMSPYL